MRAMKTIVLAASAALALTTASKATDLMNVVTPAPTYAMADESFDWGGFYFGPFADIIWSSIGTGDWGIGKAAGVNLVLGESFVLGVEGRASAYFSSGGFDFYNVVGLGRAGFILGDDFLVYGTGGWAYDDFGGGAWLVESVIGAGVEFAIGDSASLRGEITHRECVDGNVLCIVGGTNRAAVGVIFHAN